MNYMNFSVFMVIVCMICLASTNAFSPLKTNARLTTGSSSSSSSRQYLFGNADNNKPAAGGDGKKDGGLFGGMGDMMGAMKKAQEMAKQAETINKELSETVVVGQDPKGLVVAQFNGIGSPISMRIGEGHKDMSAEDLSLACSQAMADGHKRAQETMMSRMSQMYADAGVPAPPGTPP